MGEISKYDEKGGLCISNNCGSSESTTSYPYDDGEVVVPEINRHVSSTEDHQTSPQEAFSVPCRYTAVAMFV